MLDFNSFTHNGKALFKVVNTTVDADGVTFDLRKIRTKVEDLEVYNQLAKLIGVTNAKREVFIAVNSISDEQRLSYVRLTGVDDTDIGNFCLWSDTPQGQYWWSFMASAVQGYRPEGIDTLGKYERNEIQRNDRQ